MLFSESGIYSSDCMPFSIYEIPSLNLARVGGKLFCGHTADDVAKHTSEYGLTDVYQAAWRCCGILNAGYYPCQGALTIRCAKR